MNVVQLTVLLEAVGVPVLPVGAPTAGLPAIALIPGDDELGPGNRTMTRRYDVVVMVPRDHLEKRIVELDTLEVLTLQALIPSTVTVESPVRFQTNLAGETPAYIARVIPVAFTDADVDLCP